MSVICRGSFMSRCRRCGRADQLFPSYPRKRVSISPSEDPARPAMDARLRRYDIFLKKAGIGTVLVIALIRPRQAQYVLGDEGEHHVRGDRRRAVQPALPPFALDVVFAREGEAAEGVHAGLVGAPRHFRARKSVGYGKSVSGRVDLGARRVIKK